MLSADVIRMGKQWKDMLDMKPRKCVDARFDAKTAVLLKIILCFLLGSSQPYELYMPTFRNTLSVPSS